MRKSRHCTSTGSVSLRSTKRSRRSPNRKPLTTFGELTSSRGQRRKDRAWAKRLQARPLFAHYAIDDDGERTDVLIAQPIPKNPPDWAM